MKNCYLFLLFLPVTINILLGGPVYFHEVRKADVRVDVFEEPIYIEWNMLLNENKNELKEQHRWLYSYEKFIRLDVANYEDWLAVISVPYQEAFSINKEAFESAKSTYDPSLMDDVAGRFHTFLYAVYIKVDGRELCKVVGVSASEKYSNMKEAVASDRGYFTHFFEKLNGEWKLQLPKTKTWIDDLSVLPSNIDKLSNGGHVLRVKNQNKLYFFEVEGVRAADIVVLGKSY